MSIYLDCNGTTPVLPEILDAMLPYFREYFGNPASAHASGRAAKAGLDKAREQVATFINARPEQIIFTSHATEADNMALNTVPVVPGSRLVTTAVEHPAVLGPAAALEARGVEVVRVPVTSEGVVEPSMVEKALEPGANLLSVMLANNETGAIQPVAELSALAHKKNVPVHVDAAQACGKIPVDVEQLGADYLTVAGHKLYAPKGIGALYARETFDLVPTVIGGGQEGGYRHGTENVALCVGLGTACELASRTLEQEAQRQRGLGEIFLAGLKNLGFPFLLASENAPRLPNTMSIAFAGYRADELVRGLDEQGVEVSAGAACHSDQVRISHVLAAMGLTEDQARGSVRFSWGRTTSEDDMHAALRILGNVLETQAS